MSSNGDIGATSSCALQIVNFARKQDVTLTMLAESGQKQTKLENMKRVLVLFIGLSALTVNAQVSSNLELKELVKSDRSDRERNDPDWGAVNERDSQRAARVAQLLQDAQLRTAEDFYNAGMIFQHGSSPDDIKLAFSLATISSRLAPTHPALCRFVWNLTSGDMPCNAEIAWHGSAQRIGRQVFEFGHA